MLTDLLAWLLGISVSNPNLPSCPLTFDADYPQCPNWDDPRWSFDFIIVGAGTAGSTLAARLSEIPDWKILLIEAGKPPSNVSEIPGLFQMLQKTSEDWAFSVRDPSLFKGYKNSAFSMAKGKVLGGSSGINTLATTIGLPEDYDRWSELGSEGWNWSNVSEYFDRVLTTIRFTQYTATAPARSILGKSVEELGISTNKSLYGFQDVPIQTFEGERFSQAKAYLIPAKDRSNLCVVTEKLVTGVSFDQEGLVQGVEVYDMVTRTIKKVKATREVILSAGAINTPKLLMLSGIGSRTQLMSLGISARVDLAVGQNFLDHAVIPIMLQDKDPNNADVQSDTLNTLVEVYCQNRTVLDTIGISNYQGYINTLNRTTWTVPNQRPNIELLHYYFQPQAALLNIALDRFGFLDVYQNRLKQINQRNALLIILINILHPKSKGSVQLASRNPFRPPRINPGFLSAKEDVRTALEGVDFVNELLKTDSLQNYEIIDLEVPHCQNYTFDTPPYWSCYFLTFPMSLFHASGTCRMGADPQSVVNAKLQVRGVPNLRVVDSSIFPELITGHVNIPVGMVAEKAGDIIKETYSSAK